MGNSIKNKCALIVTNIAGYIHKKNVRNYATFCYRHDGSYYLMENKKIPELIFDATYPLDLLPDKKCLENYDRTKNYMHNQKSY